MPLVDTEYTVFLSGFNWNDTQSILYFQLSETDNPFDPVDSVWFDNIKLENRPDISEAIRQFGVAITVDNVYGDLYVGFANPLGVGVSPETVTMYIDGQRKPTGIGLRYPTGQNITIDIKDYWGQSLGSTWVIMQPTTFVDIAISLYEQIIYNNGTVAVVAHIKRSDGSGGVWNITVNGRSSVSFLTFRTLYNVSVEALIDKQTETIGGEVFEVTYKTKNYDNQQLGLRAITIVADTQAKALIGGISGKQISEAINGEGINWQLLVTALMTPLLTVLILGLMWYMASIGKLFFTRLIYGISLIFSDRGFNPETSIKEVGQEQTKLDLIMMLEQSQREQVASIIYGTPSIDNEPEYDNGYEPIPVRYKITPKNRVS